ncbi:MAG TPA: hypothetical protein VNB64_09990 [Solirubrobacteraceae bacterium]|nr:hypothetical protein [Solirubrobacteraceae bacterium]
MTHPGRFLAVGILIGCPAAVAVGYADERYGLGPDATFGLVMLVGVIAIVVALRIVEGPFLKRPDDRER